MKISGFEDSDIWKEARELSRLVFRLTSNGSFSKEFRFRDQIRASSGSVMDNIAEGFGRGGNGTRVCRLSLPKILQKTQTCSFALDNTRCYSFGFHPDA
jgi:hypothetical protein